MQNVTLKHPIRQMFLALVGFLVAIVLIESDGLRIWADRLEPGPLRTVALPVTASIDRVVHPLGLGAIRNRVLDETAHLGWTDDPVRLAAVSKPAAAHATESQAAACITPVAPGPKPALAGASVAPPISRTAKVAPLAAMLPRATALAPLAPVQPGKPRVVALAGDSMMAVGLSATLMRQASDNKNLRMVKAFRSGTGLARPDYFNWMDEYPAMLGREKPAVVIVAIGANDGQGFVVDGKVQAFGSDEWLKTYQERVAGFLAMVESTGARVLWVGLPPMRSAKYNERVAMINRIDYTVVSVDPRATWWNSAPFVADASGGFREFAALSDGRMMRLRADDGIHFSDEGAGLMSSVLVKWLDPPVESARSSPQAPASAPRTSATNNP
jgi:hypothetical protein